MAILPFRRTLDALLSDRDTGSRQLLAPERNHFAKGSLPGSGFALFGLLLIRQTTVLASSGLPGDLSTKKCRSVNNRQPILSPPPVKRVSPEKSPSTECAATVAALPAIHRVFLSLVVPVAADLDGVHSIRSPGAVSSTPCTVGPYPDAAPPSPKPSSSRPGPPASYPW